MKKPGPKRSLEAATEPDYETVAAAFAGTGLILRGGFVPDASMPVAGARTVVLIGNAAETLWAAFAAGRRDEPDPLDTWTRRVVDPHANRLGARAVYPNDRPYQPFQRWAQLAEPVHASPLGILIHPVHGLWHAYRAALLFPSQLPGLPARQHAASPCESCSGRPCLTACPVGAFTGDSYDVAACATHLRTRAAPDCATLGCGARAACPIAADKRYPAEQIAFHMAAFVRSRGEPDQ